MGARAPDLATTSLHHGRLSLIGRSFSWQAFLVGFVRHCASLPAVLSQGFLIHQPSSQSPALKDNCQRGNMGGSWSTAPSGQPGRGTSLIPTSNGDGQRGVATSEWCRDDEEEEEEGFEREAPDAGDSRPHLPLTHSHGETWPGTEEATGLEIHHEQEAFLAGSGPALGNISPTGPNNDHPPASATRVPRVSCCHLQHRLSFRSCCPLCLAILSFSASTGRDHHFSSTSVSESFFLCVFYIPSIPQAAQ